MKRVNDMLNQGSREMRLFLEEICLNICRFQHVLDDGLNPENIIINQEVYLGLQGAFADIKVSLPNRPAYFVEVKFDYPIQIIVSHMKRKYAEARPALENASKVILVVNTSSQQDWEKVESEIRGNLSGNLELEVWKEADVISRIQETFGVKINAISEENILELRSAIDSAEGEHSFGDGWKGELLQRSLLWHFGYWRIKQLMEQYNQDLRSVIAPGQYQNVVAVLADLSSYSSYVRDTRDENVVRHALTSFYSKTRNEIINRGGMLYQFVGDEVIGLFGIHRHIETYIEDAFKCSRALLDVGSSVSNEWQRQIDRVQNSRGVHIGVAIGDVQIVSLRPYGRARLGAVSDSINVAARLRESAKADEIIVSNSYYRKLDPQTQTAFEQLDGMDARNVGTIQAWKFSLSR